MKASTDTIAALATAPGRGAVGILRLSGPDAARIGAAIAGALPEPRRAVLRTLRDAEGGALDRGLVLYFVGPESFTGEDVVELQGHGGPAVQDLLLSAGVSLGARLARPGEFSERAFLNGRMDLAQCEAVADLIDAANAQAARAANRVLTGEWSAQITALLKNLTDIRVQVEGALDFSDEDVGWMTGGRLPGRLAGLQSQVEQVLQEARRGRRLRDGLVIALTGAPNVGKSTLLNRLAGDEVAIVTDIAGTTRDTLREHLDLGGLPVTLVDTAGLRETSDLIEREGMRRARSAIARAELAIYLVDDRQGWSATDQTLLDSFSPGPELLIVHNKCDASGAPPQVFEREGQRHLRISAATGAGLDLLLLEIHRLAGFQGGAEGLYSARARHVEALERALVHIRQASENIQAGTNAELAAEELRLAQKALGEITGVFGSEELLGAIFASFCIGK